MVSLHNKNMNLL